MFSKALLVSLFVHVRATSAGAGADFVKSQSQAMLCITVCMLVLFVKYFACALCQAFSRDIKNKQEVDQKAPLPCGTGFNHERWNRAHGNDNENIPFFFVIALAAFSTATMYTTDAELVHNDGTHFKTGERHP
jgi:hypothetical protein